MKRTPSLPGFNRKTLSNAHGGEHSKNKRKTMRPFDPKQALHVVLRSSKAKHKLSMLHPNHCNLIRNKVDQLKKRWNVSVYRYANVGNHLHLLIRAKSRADWQGFIRELAGSIAMIVTGARKGMPLAKGFWDHLVFTRIVQFGRDFKNVARYVCINLWEGSGIAVRKLLAKGQRILEMSEDGFVLVSANAPPDILARHAPYA
jgi:REP element-mobilizing transposase RayT